MTDGCGFQHVAPPFWHGGRLDALAIATAAGINQAYSEGYVLARIEGYVYPV